MNWHRHHTQHGGSAPATPGFTAVAPEWLIHHGAADAAPAIPAAESTLGSHPCVALYSAQVLPEWTTSTSPYNDFSSNGDNPLNFVSHSKGSLQTAHTPPRSPTAYAATPPAAVPPPLWPACARSCPLARSVSSPIAATRNPVQTVPECNARSPPIAAADRYCPLC